MKILGTPAHRSTRRQLLAAGAALLACTALPALADTYPSKPIRMLVPYLAGGVTDVMARQFATVMSEQLGQQVVVDNKPGANTLIATQMAATAPPDGYTIFFMDLSLLSYNAYLYKQQPYELTRDFVPVTSVAEIPLGLAINNHVPASNVKEFIAYAKANPGKLNYSSTASGGLPHLAMENFKSVTGIEMTHVPYKGAAAAITDMIGGQVQAMFNDVSTSVPYVTSGRMKVLAISGDKRMPRMPDVPTFAELGMPKLSTAAFMGIVAPAKTPPAIIARLDAAIREASKNPQVVDYLQTNNLVPRVTSGAELSGIMTAEQKKWRELVTKLDLKVD
ncbi:MAG: tripartite tricarboxylate transporter substrate binding protein [Bordetella sp.]|nr:tripartite tricarboxylate transporter substrate binding protein [Bordetella sp.]